MPSFLTRCMSFFRSSGCHVASRTRHLVSLKEAIHEAKSPAKNFVGLNSSASVFFFPPAGWLAGHPTNFQQRKPKDQNGNSWVLLLLRESTTDLTSKDAPVLLRKSCGGRTHTHKRSCSSSWTFVCVCVCVCVCVFLFSCHRQPRSLGPLKSR